MMLFIFCQPFPRTTAITNISFYLAVFIALILIISKRNDFTFKTPLTVPLMLFLLWSLLSISWSLNMRNSADDLKAHLLNHIILFFLLINFFRSKTRLAVLAWIVVISAAAFSSAGMFYYYVMMDNPMHAVRFGHLLNNSINWSTELPVNFIGTITIFAILICLYFLFQKSSLYRRMAIITCLIPLSFATILTGSKGTIIALLIAATIQLSMKVKKIIVLLLLVIVGIAMLSLLQNRMTESFTERMKINYFTYEVIRDYPIIGIGFGMETFRDDIDKKIYMARIPEKYRPVEVYTPHSLLLDITVRLGVVGLMLFLYILFTFGRICRKTIKTARDDGIRDFARTTAVLFTAYFIIGLAEPVFLFRASASVFYIILAMMTILWHLNRQEQTAS